MIKPKTVQQEQCLAQAPWPHHSDARNAPTGTLPNSAGSRAALGMGITKAAAERHITAVLSALSTDQG